MMPDTMVCISKNGLTEYSYITYRLMHEHQLLCDEFIYIILVLTVESVDYSHLI
jgi:hypothetical protein